MNIEEAIELLQTLVFAQTSTYLTNLQINLLRGSWQNQTYEQIAETYCFSCAHAKTVGAKLWEFLSQVLDTKVNKKNFQLILERKAKELATDVATDVATDGVTDVTDGVTDGVTDEGDVGDKLSICPLYLTLTDNTSVTSVTKSVAIYSPIPELPGGQVPLDSPFYIERPPIEERCYDTILQSGAFIRIYAPRQMGKTSLMARILYQAREEGYRTVTLSFQLASSNIFSSLDRFLKWFCASVGKSLGLTNQLANYWDDVLGSNYSCTDYFENYLLAELDTPIVIALDDLDIVFHYPDIASNFFCLLRTWYEKAKYGNTLSDIWKKLRLLVIHSTDVYVPSTIYQSPFNVGLSIELPEFTSKQVHDLVRCHQFDWDADQVEQLMSLVGGYPYRVRKVLYHIWYHDVSLEQLLPKSATKQRIYGEHLRQ